MSHEITEHDHVVLHRNKAWHGLGTVVADAPTPKEALKIAKLDWQVEQWPLSATDGTTRFAIEEKIANIRVGDDPSENKLLGVVGKDWVPFQNDEVAQFCEDLAQQGDVVKVESAGSIRGGQKIWFLLKGESFSVRHSDDEVIPYICVSNGFDGLTGFRCTPTTVRVVCSNTLHMVIPNKDDTRVKLSAHGYACRHMGSLDDRLAEARAALGLYNAALTEQREMIDHTASKAMDSDAVKQFFLEAYTHDFGSIPHEPISRKEKSCRQRALDAYTAFSARFDSESDKYGANAWTAFNAYSGFVQHDRSKNRNWKDANAAADRKTSTNLFGVNQQRTIDAFALALSS